MSVYLSVLRTKNPLTMFFPGNLVQLNVMQLFSICLNKIIANPKI